MRSRTLTNANLALLLGLGAGFASTTVGACRKPHPDELVYSGERRTPSTSGGTSSSPTGGSSSLSGAPGASGTDALGGSGGTSGANGGRPDAPGGEGGSDSIDAGAGGEAGTPDPGPVCPTVPVASGSFTKRGLLEAAAACAAREYCVFQGRAKTLRDRAAVAASEPSEAASAAAREAWLSAMAAWEEAEVFQFGPAATSLSPGGRGLRDLVYSWPLVARCKVDEQTVNGFYGKPAFLGPSSSSPSSGRTLHALEYLLFYAGTDNGCTQYSSINSTGSWKELGPAEIRRRRLDYAARAAEDVLRQADALLFAWSPTGDDFGSTLAMARAPFKNEQDALNAIGNALFYVEEEVKDLKLAVPLGLDVACPAERCPDQVEALHAHSSADHIAKNLRGFRKLFQGCAEGNAGFGFDDWLRAVGAGDVSTRMLAALGGVEAAVAGLDAPLETLIVNEPARVQAVYDALKALTDPLKTEFMTALNIERPPGTPGDND